MALDGTYLRLMDVRAWAVTASAWVLLPPKSALSELRNPVLGALRSRYVFEKCRRSESSGPRRNDRCGDGQWIIVRYPGGIKAAQARTVAEPEALVIEPGADLEPMLADEGNGKQCE
jgi:hypothetical protein